MTKEVWIERDPHDEDSFHLYYKFSNYNGKPISWHIATLHIDMFDVFQDGLSNRIREEFHYESSCDGLLLNFTCEVSGSI